MHVEFRETRRFPVGVAWGAMLDEAEAAVREHLPPRARAREAALFRQEAPERWVVQSTFPFV